MSSYSNNWISKTVCQAIKECLSYLKKDFSGLSGYHFEAILSDLEQPPKFEWGQVAFPCFSLAPLMRMSPHQIADLCQKWMKTQNFPLISRVESVSGYLNFFIDFSSLGKEVFEALYQDRFFNARKENPQSVLMEFSQPNTHKSIHVGHLRNLVLGEALCRLKEYRGDKVIRVTYPGDFGSHILKVLWYLVRKETFFPKNSSDEKKRGQRGTGERESEKKELDASPSSLLKKDFSLQKEEIQEIVKRGASWLGEQYAGVSELLNKEGSLELKKQYEEEVLHIFSQLKSRKGSMYKLYMKTREVSLNHMREVYQWFDVHFDKWYFESELDKPSCDFILQKYKEKILVKSQGAIGIDLSHEDLGFVLLLKSNGQGLYLTKDVELLRRKFQDYKIDRSLVVVDVRQKLHFQQLFRLSEIFDLAAQSKSHHLFYESVVDQEALPISSRKKSGMEISALREKMLSLVRERYRSYESWTLKEVEEVSNKIVVAALKYGMLRVDPHSVVKFSMNQWLKLEGETGPYIEYVYARCQSVLGKVREFKEASFLKEGRDRDFVVDVESLEGKEKARNLGEEMSSHSQPSEGKWGQSPSFDGKDLEFSKSVECQLLFEISQFNEKVILSESSEKPNILTQFLFDLAKCFHRFYTECSVLKSEGRIRKTRIHLIFATSQVIQKGLELLGIPFIKKM